MRFSIKKLAMDARKELIQKIEKKAKQRNMKEQAVVEEAAYTWFLRFVVLRFLEVNGYFHHHVLKTTYSSEALFQTTVIKTCRALQPTFPYIFSEDSRTEALFPDDMLSSSSFMKKLTDFNLLSKKEWGNVEIVGWLYQYYFTEEKERIIRMKKQYNKVEIPVVTQLFTPNWIVRYMVQNTLGKYWVEAYPEHRDLMDHWEFYIKDASFAPTRPIKKRVNPTHIKCLDPAMGSGHILSYMFDVLVDIYNRCGYAKRDIPKLIIENNLYGMDIDDRVYPIALFTLAMKAWQYNGDVCNIDSSNLVAVQESNEITEEDLIFLTGEKTGETYEKIKQCLDQFIDAKTYGSLLQIEWTEKDSKLIQQKWNEWRKRPVHSIEEEHSRRKLLQLVPQFLKQSAILQMQYDVLVTNPPYIGNRYLNRKLATYLQKNYPFGRKDLFSAFMLYSFQKVKKHGLSGFMTPYVWMFLSSYSSLRSLLLKEKTIHNLVQLEYSGYDGATVPVCTFTFRNEARNIAGVYISLANFKGVHNQALKTLEAIQNPTVDFRFRVRTDLFEKIPGHPFSFWSGPQTLRVFQQANKLETIAKPRVGLQTNDNQRFLRLWYEVDFQKIGFHMKNRKEAKASGMKWFPYNKGGEFRKWYGNQLYVVNWENDGAEIRAYNAYLNASRNSKIGIANTEFYFQESISWSFVSSSYFGARYSESGFIFDTGGSSVFMESELIYYVAAFLCSKLAYEFLKILNPTLNFQPRNIGSLPIMFPEDAHVLDEIIHLAKENISIAKKEWDWYETSWNFKTHPLLAFKGSEKTIAAAFNHWKEHMQNQFSRMRQNEQRINCHFIDIYGVDQEYTADVAPEHITIRLADKEREVKSFLSYAVGCMFGRYSLEEDGLMVGEKTQNNVKSKSRGFSPEGDSILVVSSQGFMEHNIVSKLLTFLKVTFGEETLEENLTFIANVLGRKKGETATDTIARYFCRHFYKDHLKIYKKRPIYWFFQSGKHRVFSCLIYMHKYDSSMLARIRKDYVKKLLYRLQLQRIALLPCHTHTNRCLTDRSFDLSLVEHLVHLSEKKQFKKLESYIKELKNFDLQLQHLIEQEIELNLDDGVARNYQKFAGVVAPIR